MRSPDRTNVRTIFESSIRDLEHHLFQHRGANERPSSVRYRKLEDEPCEVEESRDDCERDSRWMWLKRAPWDTESW